MLTIGDYVKVIKGEYAGTLGIFAAVYPAHDGTTLLVHTNRNQRLNIDIPPMADHTEYLERT